jgi:hypothetical protein
VPFARDSAAAAPVEEEAIVRSTSGIFTKPVAEAPESGDVTTLASEAKGKAGEAEDAA